jgi:hypothetical protein
MRQMEIKEKQETKETNKEECRREGNIEKYINK